MTTQRTVKKNLAGQEDILYGEGQVTQARNGGNYTINKVRSVYPVNSIAERDALDTTKFTKCRLYNTDGTPPVDYEYIGTTWTQISTPQSYATLAELQSNVANCVIGSSYTISERTTGNGGGGTWQCIAKTTENGFDIVTGDATRSFQLVIGDVLVDLAVLGIAKDGSDVTASFQHALDNYILDIDEGVYGVTGVTTSKYLSMTSNCRLKYLGAQNGTCLTIDADWGEVYVDCNNSDATGVTITNNGSQTTPPKGHLCFAENVTASASSATSIYGVSVNADDIKIDRIITNNTVNTGNANVSFPQAFAIVGTSDNTIVSKVYTDTGAAGVVFGSSSVRSFIGDIVTKNMADNGVYGLGGVATINSFVYQGNEESFVANGGSYSVGKIKTIGDCIAALELGSPDYVNIGEIEIQADSSGSTASKVVITRSGTGAGGECHIGRIRGEILDGTGVLAFNSKTLDYLSIGYMDLDISYSSALWTTTNNWFVLDTVSQYTLKNMTIRITDINNEAPANLSIKEGTPTKNSLIENFDVFMVDNTGAKSATQIRLGTPQQFLDIKGARWQVNVGPYAREADYLGGFRDSTTAAPTSGYWKQGQFLWHGDLTSASSFGFACTATGTPGTWVTLNGV